MQDKGASFQPGQAHPKVEPPINVAESPDVCDDRAKNVLSVSVHNEKAGE